MREGVRLALLTPRLPVHSVSVGLDPASMARFFALVLTSRSLDFGPRVDAGRPVATLEQLAGDVGADPYWREILRPSGLRHDSACHRER